MQPYCCRIWGEGSGGAKENFTKVKVNIEYVVLSDYSTYCCIRIVSKDTDQLNKMSIWVWSLVSVLPLMLRRGCRE